MPAVKHADLRKYKKQGWYIKGYKKSQKTLKCKGTYQKRCTTGFQGGRSEAHHVLPKESFDNSLAEVDKKDLVYVRWVMHVADWDLNLSANLIGLPTDHSYEQFLQDKVTLDVTGHPGLRKITNGFNNRFKKGKRQQYLNLLRGESPEGYAVHNPRSWGHPKYSSQIQNWMKGIWKSITKAQKQHQNDESKALNEAAKLPPLLTGRARALRRGLRGRAKANKAAWKKRHDRTNNTWYLPFLMAPVTKNPLTGK